MDEVAEAIQRGALMRYTGISQLSRSDLLGRRWLAVVVDELDPSHPQVVRRAWTRGGALWWAQNTARVWSRPGSRKQ